MATAVRRRSAGTPEIDPVSTFEQHIRLKHQADPLVKRMVDLKKSLKSWFEKTKDEDVYENENGSLFYDVDPFTVDGITYVGMENRKSTKTEFSEEECEKVLKRKQIPLSEVESTITFIDQDKVSRLQQEGKLTEKDVDKMFVSSESWAFWPVTE